MHFAATGLHLDLTAWPRVTGGIAIVLIVCALLYRAGRSGDVETREPGDPTPASLKDGQ